MFTVLLFLPSILFGGEWTIGEAISIHEETYPAGVSPPSSLQLVAGQSTFALGWRRSQSGEPWAPAEQVQGREWMVTVVASNGRPLRAEPLRLQASYVRVVRYGGGFAVLSLEGMTLRILLLDSLGNPLGPPRELHRMQPYFPRFIAASSGGEIVVVWTEQDRFDQLHRIRGILIHSDGGVVAGIIRDPGSLGPLRDRMETSIDFLSSNGEDLLVGWTDCVKRGTRFYTLACSASARIIVTQGPALGAVIELLPARTTYHRLLGPAASNGSEWLIRTGDGRLLVDQAGSTRLLCDEEPGQFGEQMTWDGSAFVVVRSEESGKKLRIIRLSHDCSPPTQEATIGAGFPFQLAIASLGGESALIAYLDGKDATDFEHPGLATITVRSLAFEEGPRRRVVGRSD